MTKKIVVSYGLRNHGESDKLVAAKDLSNALFQSMESWVHSLQTFVNLYPFSFFNFLVTVPCGSMRSQIFNNG